MFDPQAKILANIDRVIDFLRGKNPPPILVEIDPSNTCNHGCFFCISSYIHLPESKELDTYNKDILKKGELLKLCQDLIDMDIRAINWTGGGEPSVNPHLAEAINLVGKSNIKMGMFTNGTLLDKHGLLEAVVNNLTWIRISVDAGTPETYNRVRRVKPNQDWNKMVSNLELLLETKKRLNKNLDIGVGFVITEDSYTEILDFANFFSKYDIKYCQFKPEIVNKERKDGVQNTVEFWKKINPLLDQAKKILGSKFKINGYKLDDLQNDPDFFGRSYKKCLGSQVQPCVGADGNVYVCTNQRGYPQYSYGNIYEKSFKDIWKDVNRKQTIMFNIDEVEKFSTCTQLCKPHESNKKVWEIAQNINNEEYVNKLLQKREEIYNSIEHPEFI